MSCKHIMAVFFLIVCFTATPVCAGMLPPDQGNVNERQTVMYARVPGDIGPGEQRMGELEPAKGRFLVATRGLKGSVFEESVILLIDYSWHGATGLIINKPGRVNASEFFPDVNELGAYRDNIYLGGPVELGHINLLIRADRRPAESENIFQDVYFSLSMSALKEAAGSHGKGVKFRMYVGYSGWAPGQLAQEIQRGSWYVMEGDQGIVFSDTPSFIWQKLIRKRSPLLDSVFREPDGGIQAAGLYVP